MCLYATRTGKRPAASGARLLALTPLLLLAGCCGPLIRSQRFPADLPPATMTGARAEASKAVGGSDLRLGLLHAIGGPFAPAEIVGPYQSTMRPPHSRFHPVPTYPVFSPRGPDAPLPLPAADILPLDEPVQPPIADPPPLRQDALGPLRSAANLR